MRDRQGLSVMEQGAFSADQSQRLVQIRCLLSDAERWAGGRDFCMILLAHCAPIQLLLCSTFSQLECLSRLSRGLLRRRGENSKLDPWPSIQPDLHSQQQDTVTPAVSCASEAYFVGCGRLWATWFCRPSRRGIFVQRQLEKKLIFPVRLAGYMIVYIPLVVYDGRST